MTQRVYGLFNGNQRLLELPLATSEVMPGVRWGRFDCLFTPAFWASQLWAEPQPATGGVYRLGRSLREEVAACLLGGYGMPAEIGVAAFERIRSAGLLRSGTSRDAIFDALSDPLEVGKRILKYRFPAAKAAQLAASLQILDRIEPSPTLSDRAFRDWLIQLPGVGLKTASWITRNIRDSDDVAILDIHIFRACRIAAVFPKGTTIGGDYLDLEARFVAFARALCVRASRLDAVMWEFMRSAGQLALSVFNGELGDAPLTVVDGCR